MSRDLTPYSYQELHNERDFTLCFSVQQRQFLFVTLPCCSSLYFRNKGLISASHTRKLCRQTLIL